MSDFETYKVSMDSYKVMASIKTIDNHLGLHLVILGQKTSVCDIRLQISKYFCKKSKNKLADAVLYFLLVRLKQIQKIL